MTVVLVDPNVGERGELVASLRQKGFTVAPFSDPGIALLFLLGKLGEVEGVLVSDEAEWSSDLRERLEVLPVALTVVTYSRRRSAPSASVIGSSSSVSPLFSS